MREEITIEEMSKRLYPDKKVSVKDISKRLHNDGGVKGWEIEYVVEEEAS